MSKVGSKIVLGTLWITAGIGMHVTDGSGNEIGAAILVVLGMMFYWSAFKIFKDPRLVNKNKKNIVQQMSDTNYNKASQNLKKK